MDQNSLICHLGTGLNTLSINVFGKQKNNCGEKSVCRWIESGKKTCSQF